MNKSVLTLLVMTLWVFAWNEPAKAASDAFTKAMPGYTFSFPRDHGSHPDYLIEWWYFTGNLSSEKGKSFGYELTFFRRGIENKFKDQNPSLWSVHDVYLAHFAVTDIAEKQFYYDEKISRAALGKAGAKIGKMDVWIDRWSAAQEGDQIRLKAGDDQWGIEFILNPAKPLVVHGEQGISKKGEERGAASHYYSFTRLETSGTLITNGKAEQVSGLSWMDHEFGSLLLGEGQVGWDWFSIQLDDGSEYMFYQIRETAGGKDPISSGTIIFPDGTTQDLKANDFKLTPTSYWKSKLSDATYPLHWEISVPSESLTLTAKPVLNQQELITTRSTRMTYWEGATDFHGQKKGKKLKGKGYIELTGYAGKLLGAVKPK